MHCHTHLKFPRSVVNKTLDNTFQSCRTVQYTYLLILSEGEAKATVYREFQVCLSLKSADESSNCFCPLEFPPYHHYRWPLLTLFHDLVEKSPNLRTPLDSIKDNQEIYRETSLLLRKHSYHRQKPDSRSNLLGFFKKIENARSPAFILSAIL